MALGFSGEQVTKLTKIYQSVLDQLDTDHIDFDIEGANVQDQDANDLRSAALKQLQDSNKDLKISYTLPVLPTGLTGQPTAVLGGYDVVESSLKAGVDIVGVNIMTMDYGDSAAPMNVGKSMGDYTVDAANSTFDQMYGLFNNYDQVFEWKQIGITPMIGINDVHDEVFFIKDAQTVIDFANQKGVGMLSMWSLTRDQEMPDSQSYYNLPGNSGLTNNAVSINTKSVYDSDYVKGGFIKAFSQYQPAESSLSVWDQGFAPYIDFGGWCSGDKNKPCSWPMLRSSIAPDYLKYSGPYDPSTIATSLGWTQNQKFNLAFIQSDPNGAPSWAGTSALAINGSVSSGADQVNAINASLKLIKSNGGNYAVSFGGASGIPLAAHILTESSTVQKTTTSDGHVSLKKQGGKHVVLTGASNASVIGNNKSNNVEANDGHNSIDTGKGADTIAAGYGNDTIASGNGKDIVAADNGDDEVNSGGGSDFIHGGSGNDSLSGQSGNDFIHGGSGNDIIHGGSGSNTSVGGSGSDTFVFTRGANTIDDFRSSQGDKIQFVSGDSYSVSQGVPDTDSLIKSSSGGTMTLVGVSPTQIKNLYPSQFASKVAPAGNDVDDSKDTSSDLNLFDLSFIPGSSWGTTTAANLVLKNTSAGNISSDWSVSFHSDYKVSGVSNFSFVQQPSSSGGYDITLSSPSWRDSSVNVGESLTSYFQISKKLDSNETIDSLFTSIVDTGSVIKPASTTPSSPTSDSTLPSELPFVIPTAKPSELLANYQSVSGSWNSNTFSPYVDITLSPTPDLNAIATSADIDISNMHFNVAFIQSSSDGFPAWAGNDSLKVTDDPGWQVGNIQTSLAKAQLAGAELAISFGGFSGTSLASNYVTNGRSARDLADTYAFVRDTYKVNRLDFDVEGDAASNTNAIKLRSKAIALFQKDQVNTSNPSDLSVWFTLAVLPSGLTSSGLNIVQSAVDAGVEIGGVNIMAMDYGSGFTGSTMGDYANEAAKNTFDQITGLLKKSNSPASFGYENIGITPMIGVNDVKNNIFTLDDVTTVINNDAPPVGMFSMWELGRDKPGTTGGYSNTGLTDSPFAFTAAFYNGLDN